MTNRTGPREPSPVPPEPGKTDPIPPEMPQPGSPEPEDMPTPRIRQARHPRSPELTAGQMRAVAESVT